MLSIKWNEIHEHITPELLSRICRVTGFTEVDIKSINYLFAWNIYVVRTYNWRKLYVTGEMAWRIT